MNKYISVGIFIFLLSIFVTTESVAVEVRATPVVIDPTNDITKLDIIPQYGNIRLQPGESKETIVTVKNNNNTSVNVQPNIAAMSYGSYVIDTNWITITPNNVDIPAGESVKFTINVSIPTNATIGSSSVQIVFTNETVLPTEIQPIYTDAFQLSIDVWKLPNLQTSTQYLNDQIEVGKVYDYEIKIKNTGNNVITINPKVVNDVFYGTYGISAPILTEDSINITAPDNISAGAIETINIHVNTPTDVTGSYNGYIDLVSDDPLVQEGEGRISLSFNIWKQPTESFVKNFSLDRLAPIKIEISSYYNQYPYIKTRREEPSFDTKIVGPEGDVILNATKTVIKGNVNMGSDSPSWVNNNVSTYNDIGIQQIITYNAVGSPGEWKLNILPNNTQAFEYSITIGEDR